jgi:predicted ATPase
MEAMRIRKIEISNFRCIQSFTWRPSPGLNCLIGPGDSGKSTVLDAIDLCLGARRVVQFSDADFHNLDVTKPISIVLTIGELDDSLKNMDAYGIFLRGFNSVTGEIEDDPGKGLETILTLSLTVGNDLDAVWALISDGAAAAGTTRSLSWADRLRLAPTVIGTIADHNLSWRRGSVLNKLADDKPDASAALVLAARHARTNFGDEAAPQLATTLGIVKVAADELGIEVGSQVRALLDAHSVTFGGGISLHNETGIPLHGLGLGSTRLLIAGLQRKAAAQSAIVIVDELEHGLEPHRIIRLLGSLAAKETPPPLQAFMTTHSPIAVQELSAEQLYVLRQECGEHTAHRAECDSELQGLMRIFPDAFLAASIVVCEGASEVGLVRGLDQYRAAMGKPSLFARGVALVDCGGGDPDRPFRRATAFHSLGYRVAVLRDDDKKPSTTTESNFQNFIGSAFAWQADRSVEEELFASLSDAGVRKLVEYAVALHGHDFVDQNIKSASSGMLDLSHVEAEYLFPPVKPETRALLGRASKKRAPNGWYKSVTWMEEVGREIVAPDFNNCDPKFRAIIMAFFKWAAI